MARNDGPAPDGPTRAQIRSLPKVELHCHLDGAVRPATLLDLARRHGIALPADDEARLLPHVTVASDCRSLRDFLATFESFYPVLRVPGAMGRIAREAVQDAARDGVVHLELRLCPDLQVSPGWSREDVLTDVLHALDAAGEQHGVSWGVIVCCYRSLGEADNAALVELALAHADRGVVGLDLAGPEDLPGRACEHHFARAREAGLPVTVHAGEAAGPESVREAVEVLVATRLGHAVALARDPALSERVRSAGIALECCLTSNLVTGAVPSLAQHPFDAFLRAGHLVTLCSDDPAVCRTTLSAEYELAARTWGYDLATLRGFALAAADAAFVSASERERLRALIAGARPGQRADTGG